MAVAVSELSYPALLPRVAEFVRREHRMFVNGEWVTSQAGGTLAVFDPATGGTIAHVPAGNAAGLMRPSRLPAGPLTRDPGDASSRRIAPG